MPTPMPLGTPIGLKVELAQYGGNGIKNVYADYANQGLYPKAWFDANLDGDADDLANSDLRSPICYGFGHDVKVVAIGFHCDSLNSMDASKAQIIGKAGGQTVFTSTTVIAGPHPAGGWSIHTNTLTGSITAATVIDFWEDYEISWYLNPDTTVPASQPVFVGTTKNTIHYVPDISTLPLLRHSYIDIACRRAKGMDPSVQTNWEAIAVKVYEEFEAGNMVRAQDRLYGVLNPQVLAYYREWQTPHTSSDSLLFYGDGQCGAWTMFFARCLQSVGVDPNNELLEVRSIYSPNVLQIPTFFLVNSWVAAGAQGNPHPDWLNTDWPYLNVPTKDWENFDKEVNNDHYDFCHEDFLDLTGAPGQGTIDPASLFATHLLIQVGDKIFDPSYGTPPYGVSGPGDDRVAAFENTAIAGYALQFGVTAGSGLSLEELHVNCDLDGDGDIDADPEFVDDAKALILQTNLTGNQLRVTESDL